MSEYWAEKLHCFLVMITSMIAGSAVTYFSIIEAAG